MTEREQKIGDILDGLGVTLDMDDGDLIASALVIAKVIDADGDAQLAMMTSDGLSWSAQQVVSQRHVDRKGEDE